MGIFRDLFDIATSGDVGKVADTLATLNDGKRIRSISSMSSRSIFYFPMFVSEDHSAEEIEMMQKYAEMNYSVMVAECFAQVPTIKVRPNDMNQISAFLDRFHQNLGTTTGSGEAARKFTSAVSFAGNNLNKMRQLGVFENAVDVISEQWEKYKDYDNKPVKRLDESYTSLNDVFNLNPLDPVSEANYKLGMKRKEELSNWGFLGESVPDDMFGFDMASEDEDLPDTDPVTHVTAEDNSAGSEIVEPVDEATTKEAYSKLAAKLDQVPDNKIKSAKNRAALRKLESKLNSMKKKYTKYLIRYKKKYESNDNSKKKLTIRFEGMSIDDPKSFMKVYGEFIKVVNKKLALCAKRKEEINKTSAKAVAETGSFPAWLDAPLESCSLTDLDEMAMNLVDMVEYDVNTMCEATDDQIFSYTSIPIDEANNPTPAPTPRKTVGGAYSPIRGGKMFTEVDLKKANDALPTIIMVNVKMAVIGTDQITDYTFPVGIKVHIYKVPIDDMISTIGEAVTSKRKLLSFIKLTSGEESTIGDMIFGISKMKKEVAARTSKNSAQIYRSALQRRKKLSKMSIPFLTKEYTLNGSMLLSQNIAEQVKTLYGVDLLSSDSLRKLMMEEFLFAVYITNPMDQSCKIFYDNDLAYNEVTYNMLQRQAKQSEMQMKDLLRILGTTQR